MSVRIEIDFNVTAELAEIYAESSDDPFVGESDGPYSIDVARLHLERIARTQTYGKLPRLGFMKIYYNDALVGFSFPRKLQPEEYEKFKLLEFLTYHRVGTVFIRKDYRGKGIVSAAIQLFMLTHPYLLWTCDINNAASANAARKAGLTETHKLYFLENKEWFMHEPLNCVRTSLVFNSYPVDPVNFMETILKIHDAVRFQCIP